MGRVAAPTWADDDDSGVSFVQGHGQVNLPDGTTHYSILSLPRADAKRRDDNRHGRTTSVDGVIDALQQVRLNCEHGALQATRRNPHSIEAPPRTSEEARVTLVSDASNITRKNALMQQTIDAELEKVRRSRADMLSKIAQNVKRLEIQLKAALPPKPVVLVPSPKQTPIETAPPSSPPPTPPASPPTRATNASPKAAAPSPVAPTKPHEAVRPDVPDEFVLVAKSRMEKLKQLEASIVPFADSQDPNMKRIRVLLKKKLGEACNQIANSLSSIRLVVDKIRQSFGEAKAAGEIYFHFALHFVASKLTAQVRVIAEISSCFPVANVVAMCCVHTPDLTDVFLAHMHTMCPYTIPTTPVRSEGQSDDAYRLSIGMEQDTNHSFESFDKYTQRMAMAVALLLAVMQTSPFDGQPQPAHLAISDAWTWMARVVNAAPHPLTAPILLAALETAGFELHRQYKSQFLKLASVIQSNVVPILSRDVKSGAAATLAQLTTFVTQRSFVTEPEGRRPTETSVTAADEEKSTKDDNNSSNRNDQSYNSGYGQRGGRGGGRGGYRR
ncbi:hypothetical protein H257_15632 [Aphanomyces astaci]|uniref:mRNA export factor GLE1 n=1 Tax=Aphanomyces astaci TaxID=112090 RepID=W4FNP6_APHAT|nr:hypothetical protein H257_15632 [Aphanomyces astaci]ETV68474.1 hypothetical protein H257_15632 [Aphanomyces astaci]|eukprot:XP_009842100.1 hypothetical protein H257_15632 [Aphanomyces astaci]